MRIFELSTMDTLALAEAAARAGAEGRKFRVAVDGNTFKFKVGEGMWSPPCYDVLTNEDRLRELLGG